MTRLVAAIRAAQQAKPRRKRKEEEHSFQRTLFPILDLVLPDDAILSSVDHAGAASRIVGAMRKARGVLSGFPDTLIAWQPDKSFRLHICVWLELKKRKNGRFETEQEIWRDILLASGHYWGAPRTIEEALATIRESGIPLRPIRL